MPWCPRVHGDETAASCPTKISNQSEFCISSVLSSIIGPLGI